MRVLFISFLSLFFLNQHITAQSTSFWSDIREDQMRIPDNLERDIRPLHYKLFSLDLQGLKTYLQKAPTQRGNQSFQLELPLPDGTTQIFDVWEDMVMPPTLASRYPEIRTFAGRNSKKNSSVVFDYGVHGFHASIKTPQGLFYIDPYAFGVTNYYLVYNVKDDMADAADLPPVACGFNPSEEEWNDFSNQMTLPSYEIQERGTDLVELREYVMVFACTGEFGASQGGTLSGVMSAYNTMMTRLNQIYQNEFASRFILHPDTDRVIFTNSQTDPYPIGNQGGNILGLNATVVNARINPNSYDISHCFTRRCNDVGGIASLGSLCNQGASGVTCHSSSSVTFTIVNITAHEVGHQFSCAHTWDNCGSPQRGIPYEPGSGTTIMSYAGLCGNQNIVNNINDDYFHVGSIIQATTFIQVANGNTCATVLPTTNHFPEISLPYINGFYIPNGTPFELEGAATDEDGDRLTYCWEQYDRDPMVADIGNPIGNSPIYRSYYPSTNPQRVFPKLDVLLGYADSVPYEILADYARNLTFRLTVRDNNPQAGGVAWDEVSFKTDDNERPFAVLVPSDRNISWKVGNEVAIEWDVADSDQAPVNCKSVNIKLSVDGGFTYPITLAENTPNDGFQMVFVPEINPTTRARVRVEAADNIFFNVSRFNFEVLEADEPGFAVNVNPTFHYACLPENFVVDIETTSILDYDSLLHIEIISSLPNDLVPSFIATTLLPGENTTLELDMPNGLGSGTLNIDLIIYANGSDTVHRTISLELVSNDFSNLALVSPFNGQDAVSEVPLFSWTRAADAQYYEIQIATSPAFAPQQIVFSAVNLTDTFYRPLSLLDENSAFYWRVRPVNICGPGDYLPASAFHTFAKICNTVIGLEGENQRIPIGGTGRPTIESNVTIIENGTVNDLNLPNIRGSYEPVSSLRMTLLSPQGTSAILFETRCNGSVFNFGFDDAIINRNPCPSNDGKIRGPQEFLSIFNDEPVTGTWTLRLEVVEPGFGGGGSLEEWTLELCANTAPSAPVLKNNAILCVPPGGTNRITPDFLLVEDDDNGPEDLTFTIVTLPQHGKLYFAGREVKIGDQFRQSSINANNVWYEHDGSPDTEDSFSYTVRDKQGGWLATPQFEIEVDPNCLVGVGEIDLDSEVLVYPNPASDQILAELGPAFNGQLSVRLFNVQGQVVYQQDYLQNPLQLSVSTSHLRDGMYFMHLSGERGSVSKRIVVKR